MAPVVNKTVQCLEDDFQAHVNDHDGLCLACGEWTSGGVEPDAENYRCEACSAYCVMGAETALVLGHVEIVDYDENTEIGYDPVD